MTGPKRTYATGAMNDHIMENFLSKLIAQQSNNTTGIQQLVGR